MGYRDHTDPVAEAEGVAAAHRDLLDHLASVDDIEADRPSRLDGWSVGHVLTHLARNADSHRAMLAGRLQYDDGMAGRDAEIEAGGDRPLGELVTDLAAAATALDERYRAEQDWDREVRWLAGSRAAGYLPLARRREVEVHRVDLDLGYGLGDVPVDYVTRDLSLLEVWWQAANRGSGRTLPALVAELGPRDRWSWFVGRLSIDDVAGAGLL